MCRYFATKERNKEKMGGEGGGRRVMKEKILTKQGPVRDPTAV